MSERRTSSRNSASLKRSYADDSDFSDAEGDHHKHSKRSRQPAADNLNGDSDEDDDDDDDDDDDENLDGESGQIPKAKHEAGQIRKIYIENFLNHRKFTLDFNRHLTFITGANGSGKSAVAAAIQVCLGSSARQTGRGSNAATYIREGSEGPAVIEITLFNEGPDAFRPELYGKRIVLKKQITRSNTSTYQVKQIHDGDMKWKTMTKTELNKILTNFSLFVDTPTCILTQEESKKLVQGSDRDKYDFFLKATGLSTLHGRVEQGLQGVEAAEQACEMSEGSIKEKEDIAKAAKKKLDRFIEMNKVDDKIKLCKAKIEWWNLQQSQYFLEEKEAAAEVAVEALDKLQGEIEEQRAGTGNQSLEEQTEALNEETRQLDAQLGPVEQTLQERTAAVVNQKKVQTQVTRQLKTLEADLREKTVQLADAEKGKQELIAKQEQDSSKAQLREATAEQTSCTGAIEEARRQQQHLQAEKDNVARSKNQTQTEISRLSSQMKYTDTQIRETANNIQNYKSGGGRDTRFGRYVPQIHQKIEQNRSRFRGEVLGPIGTLVSIKEGFDQYSDRLEKVFGGLLNAFVVTCPQDRNVLFGLLKSIGRPEESVAGYHNIIMQTPHGRYNVPLHPEGFPTSGSNAAVTAADALVFSNDSVFNVLVDQAGIHLIGFIEKEDDARAFIQNNPRSGNRELKFGLTSLITARSQGGIMSTIMYRDGNQSSVTSRHQFRNVLAADTATQIAALEEELAGYQQKAVELKEAQLAVNREISTLSASEAALERQIKNCRQEERQLGFQKQALDDRVLELQEVGQASVVELQNEIDELKALIEQTESAIEEKRAQLEGMKAPLESAQEEKAQASEQQQSIRDRLEAIADELNDLLRSQADVQNRLADLEKELQKEQAATRKTQEDVRKAAAERDNLRHQAETTTRQHVPNWDGQPLELGRNDTDSLLKRTIATLERNRQKQQEDARLEGYSLAVLQDRYDRACQEQEKATEEYETVQRRLGVVREEVEEVERRYKVAYKRNKKLTKFWFNEYCKKQKMEGSITFNSKERTMILHAATDNADENTKTNDVRNCSGGERSFISLCMLLALGHVSDSPFRLMDEYDVFMDTSRRIATLNELQAYAVRPDQQHRQLIIITPQNLDSVRTGPKVKIIKMIPPVKVSAHGLQQQTL